VDSPPRDRPSASRTARAGRFLSFGGAPRGQLGGQLVPGSGGVLVRADYGGIGAEGPARPLGLVAPGPQPAQDRALLGPGYSARQATYDLRRLRRKQVICRIPGTHRYQLTSSGRAVAVLFTKAYGRILGPGLAFLDPRLPDDLANRSPLATAWRNLARELDHFISDGLAPA